MAAFAHMLTVTATAASAAALSCLLALGGGVAYAETPAESDQVAETIAFAPEGASAFTSALSDIGAVVDAGAAARERDMARYLRDVQADHADRTWRWGLVQDWRARFPEGDYSDVLFIGDSLMDEARYYMAEAMPGCEVNADSGRTLEEGGLIREDAKPAYGVLDHIRSDDGSHGRYVIGTGNNDVGGMPLSAAEEIVACLGPDKEIYFITEMVTGNPGGTANTNATIDAMVAAYPNVHAIDWHGFVEGREGELLRDVCHPNDYGKPLYAEVLKAGLDVCYAR